VLTDGRVLRHVVARALGDAERPLDDASLRAKVIDCATRAAVPLTLSAADRLAERIMRLEHEPDVGSVLASYT